ncbi:hypothetical protein LOK49_LG12G00143 [Camellia lanceoleosa]|uniref:Uncharacterized protein n=1 Tax=Camellia lanceoleosa TaxID=1840588 RepID=A0ACC0FT12_9ERIC|nr:hypothetical protein LOK49_LG12G00143 [Camellia lanceoleosa]
MEGVSMGLADRLPTGSRQSLSSGISSGQHLAPAEALVGSTKVTTSSLVTGTDEVGVSAMRLPQGVSELGQVETDSSDILRCSSDSQLGNELVVHCEFAGNDLGSQRVSEEVGFSSSAVDGEVVPQLSSADGLALVLQPLAMEDGRSDDLREQHQNLIQNSGGLDGLAIPSSEAVSNWVLERIRSRHVWVCRLWVMKRRLCDYLQQ